MSNIETVQSIYAAFGRGDVEAILGRLSESVEWEYGGPPSTDVPWLQPRSGRAGAAEFFGALRVLEFPRFDVKLVAESGDTVIALVDLEAVITATGRRMVEEDEAHIWQFGADGLVTRFRHRVDTHLQWMAYHGKEG